MEQMLQLTGTHVAEMVSAQKYVPYQFNDMVDSTGHPTSKKKSDPAREQDCIQCLACESNCPTAAIKITT